MRRKDQNREFCSILIKEAKSMEQHKKLRHRRFLLFVMPALAGMVYLGGTVWSFSNNARKNIVKVNNLTQSCTVLSAERHNGHVKLSFRNDSNKNITAFVISSVTSPRDVFTVTQEFAYSEVDFVIAPGSIYEMRFGIDSDLNNQRNPSIDLSAVIFDDKSSEGDPQVAQGIADERLACKARLVRFTPLLDKMLALLDNKLASYFNGQFKRDLATALSESEEELFIQLNKERPQIMSQQGEDKFPQQIQVGLHNGKGIISEKVRDLESLQKAQGEYALREKIIWLQQTYEKIISRL